MENLAPNGGAVNPSFSQSQGEHENNGSAEEGQPTFVENPFVDTATEPTSTFSADVDTASYSYFRKLVNSGYSFDQLKNNGSAFRTEEFINYFTYETVAPTEGQLFGVLTEAAVCPWNAESVLLRMTLQAPTVTNDKGNNLVFLVDVWGTMQSSDKLDLLKESFSVLVRNLTENDTVSIVTYSGKEAVVLSGAKGNESDRILSAIGRLEAKGSTNGEAGLTRAYAIAEEHLIEGGNNRIILASDGDLNVGISSAEELKSYVENKRNSGVFLSVLGFGTGNYRDKNMEALAQNGNGVYYYIDGKSEAEKVFGDDLLGTLHTVGKDAKLQITFDANAVKSYRLIGYENRLLQNEDFNNDQKDAGEVGAGHCVTVCYELKLEESAFAEVEGESAPWMKLSIRYKQPNAELSELQEMSFGKEIFTELPSKDFQFISTVIQICMLLHKSGYLPSDVTLPQLENQLVRLGLEDVYHKELMVLLHTLNIK